MKFEQRDIIIAEFFNGREWKERPVLVPYNFVQRSTTKNQLPLV